MPDLQNESQNPEQTEAQNKKRTEVESSAQGAHKSPQPLAPRLQPMEHGLFFGPLGLRAGWGITIYLAVAGVIMSLLFMAAALLPAGFTQPSRAPSAAARQDEADPRTVPAPQPAAAAGVTPAYVLLTDGVLLLSVLASSFVMGRLESSPMRRFGLGRRSVLDLLPGAATGLLLLAGLVAVLHALHLLVFAGRVLHGAAAARSGAAWLVTFAVVGAFEEYFFRGYLQYTLTRGLLGVAARLAPAKASGVAFLVASVVLSIAFGTVHLTNGGESWSGILSVFLAGLMFSYALWRTGSLWWGLGFHATWDWAQSFLFGVPDSGLSNAGALLTAHAAGNPLLSGGAAGPEGSLLIVPTLLLAVAALRLMPARPHSQWLPLASGNPEHLEHSSDTGDAIPLRSLD